MTNPEKALKGSKKELTALYSKTESKVYELSFALTTKKDSAIKITKNVMTSLFTEKELKLFKSTEELEASALKKAVLLSKQAVSNENNRALRLPKDMNFISEIDQQKEFPQGLSPILRFIYLCCDIYNQGIEAVCTATKFDKKTLLTAKDQLEKYCADKAISKSQYDSSASLPQELSKTKDEIIGKLCAAQKEKLQKTLFATAAVLFFIGVITVVIVAAVMGAQNPVNKDGILVKPSMTFDSSKEYYAEIDIKDHGKITVKLEPDSAPITVSNFIELANDGYYDGVGFHRIINGFMMQGGSPDGSGNGGPERRIKGEFTSNGVNNTLKHTRGAISMARTNDPDSAGSQFFIMHQDKTHLDGEYAVFGYVTEGIEIVDEICGNASTSDIPTAPEDRPIMNTVKIIVK